MRSCPPIVTAMLGVGEKSRMVLSFLESQLCPAGHHVSALPRLDREPVKAVSPACGWSEAESLDRVEASRRIAVVMAGVESRDSVRSARASSATRRDAWQSWRDRPVASYGEARSRSRRLVASVAAVRDRDCPPAP